MSTVFRNGRNRLPLVGLVLALVAMTAHAQVDTGTILGTVTDSTQAVVSRASVILINQQTAARQVLKTGADGRFVFTPLRVGTYTLEAESSGFKKTTVQSISLNVQQQALINIVLQPGAVTENIQVTSEPELLQTQNASVGQVIEEKTIKDMPLNGRDWTKLVLLTPGVTAPQQNARASNQFVANGTRAAQNNYLLDGIDNNSNSVDFLDGSADVVKPPVDAIGEFKAMTSDFPAEFGRAGGAIVNAVMKSGTNRLHGSVWEFFRNDALDANLYNFSTSPVTGKKAELRQNLFGATAGWRLFRDKTFWFADYEGTRKTAGGAWNNLWVPTTAESSSGFTNFQDLYGIGYTPSHTDFLGRTYPGGQVFDPATTRAVTAGQADPVTGLTATQSGYVREPFANNQIPANRLDSNAIKLLQLLPAPTVPGVIPNNFSTVANGTVSQTTADMRIDQRFNDKNQAFFRYSYISSVRDNPPPFKGVADGGGYGSGHEVYNVRGFALSYTHLFSDSLINEARAGYTRSHDTRNPSGDSTMGIPAKYGIQGVPQLPLNGGLPYLGIQGLSGMGGAGWLPGNRYSEVEQLTENLTKVYKKHTMKAGVEFQYIYFPWIAPPASKGNFYFDGNYTSVPQNSNGTDWETGRAQFLLSPTKATVPNGVDYSGGLDQIYASNFGEVHANRNYYGAYLQDDWAVTSRLTLNLGARWEHFGLTGEAGGAQANFIQPSLKSNSGAEFIMTKGHMTKPGLSTDFMNALQKDGIALVFTDKYGTGMGTIQKLNFAPRLGAAYSITPKLVARAGFGMFYGAFENRGGYPSLGYNYPFQYEIGLTDGSNGGISTVDPVKYTDGTTGTLENGMAGIPLDPTKVGASGLALRGIQLNYQTPYTMGYNAVVQYQLGNSQSIEAAYVGSQARHLEASPGQNIVTQLLPAYTPLNTFVPFPDFPVGMPYFATAGNSNYNSLQTKWIHRPSRGLSTLVGYTLAKVLTDAGDSLSNGAVGGYRAPGIVGIKYDMDLASFNITHQFIGSGSYELPFGRGKQFFGDLKGPAQVILGGWSANAILTLDSGQPQTIGSQAATPSGTSANAVVVPGVNKYRRHVKEGWYNPKAFTDPTPTPTTAGSALNLSMLGGSGTQVNGPGYRDLDFSLFKRFDITERTSAEFRAEAFNASNTPSFSTPGNTNYKSQVFGQISGQQGNPRILQFALKIYY